MIPKCKACNSTGIYVIILIAVLFVGVLVGCNWCRLCSVCTPVKEKKKITKVIPKAIEVEKDNTYDAI